MKKIILTTMLGIVFLSLSSNLKAGGAIFEMYTSVSTNGGGAIYYGAGGSNTGFNAATLATDLNPNTNTLVMKTEGLNAWADNSSVQQTATMYYRVYLSTATPPAFTSLNLPMNGGLVGNNSNWQTNTDINLLAGVKAIGTYNVEIFFQTTTNNTNVAASLYYSNSGANYIATFSTNVVLSTEMVSFGTTQHNGQNNLSWTTASEQDAAQFNIQRSTNSQSWQTIGSVKATNKTTGSKYSYTDEAPLSTTNYYRLQMVDVSGAMAYSKVVSIGGKEGKQQFLVYPNPVKSSLTIQSDGDIQGLSIFDITGRLVRQITDNRTQVDVQDLPSGVYIARLIGNTGLASEPLRFVKQ